MDLEAREIEGYSDWEDLAEETFKAYWAAEDGIEYLDLAWRRFKRNKMDDLTRAVYIDAEGNWRGMKVDGVFDWLEEVRERVSGGRCS